MSRPPGPGTLETIAAFVRSRGSLPDLLEATARRYGDVALVRTGFGGFYLLSHPDLVADVLETHDDRFQRTAAERRVSGRLLREALFASEGELHRRQRSLLEPVMYERAAPTHGATVVQFAERMTEGWRDGRTIDVLRHAELMTTGLMMKVLFGVDVAEPAGAELARAIVRAIDALNGLSLAATAIPDRLPLPATRRFLAARARLDSIVDGLAARRQSEGLKGPDLLSMLLAARDEEGRSMRTGQARDESLALFRGQQGVGAALAWTWHLLARHPEAERRLLDEIDAVVGKRRPALDDPARLPFTRAVFREALRLYPPAWVLARTATTEHAVGGHVIPRGATVLVSPWVLHRDPRFWKDPLKFDPNRFAGDEGRVPDHAYFPQGAGPKRCMGMEFLPMEAVMILASVGRTWRLRPKPGHVVRPSPKITLKPRGGLQMITERRVL